MEDMFRFFRAMVDKLTEYGFRKKGDLFEYSRDIADAQFTLIVTVDGDSRVSTRVIDKACNEEFVLHLVGGVGEFVGKVRQAIDGTLAEIRDSCFEKAIHKSVQAKEIIEYIRSKYGDEAEYLWSKYPTDAIWRRADNKKWYALIMTISESKLGLKSNDLVDIMDVRVDPDEMDSIVDNKIFFHGYHMNKSHWLTFILNGSVATETLLKLIDKSYALAK